MFFIYSLINICYQGGKRVLEFYKNSVQLALFSLYPNIGLLKTKFNKVQRKFATIYQMQ